MKKIVLIAALLLLFTTPCLAQYKITEGIFLENTAWDLLALPGVALNFAVRCGT